MKISIITLFPEIFEPVLNSSILKRSQQKKLVEFELVNLRDFGQGIHKSVDERPYGGGAGMILKADVLTLALQSIKPTPDSKTQIVLTSASGTTYNQKTARDFSKLDHIIIICGHYEGVDQRFIDKYIDVEISIGDYVLTGGEIPAMAIADSVVRLIPKVLEKEVAIKEESFSNFTLTNTTSQLLEYPHYTRPKEFEKITVPAVLLSGNHQAIAKWREEQAVKKTKKLRPDLLKRI